MPRSKKPRRRRAGASGFSLVEVMVAMLIGAVMVTAVLGAAVSATQGTAKSNHRAALNQGIAQVSAELKNYVTACGCVKSTGACPAGNCTLISGPNSNNGANTWSINLAPGPSGTITDLDYGNGWALACGINGGTHRLSGVVPALEAAPYNGQISYTVSWPVGGCSATVPANTDAPAITFNATWNEP